MSHDKIYDQPSRVIAKDGKVLVDGPDGVAISLTPDAAIETSERLLEQGLTARGQQRNAKLRDRPLNPSPVNPKSS